MSVPARLAPRRLAVAIAVAVGSASGGAAANPTGAQVIHGTASFAHAAPGVLNITNSAGAVLNWQSFDIGAGEVTRFIQPSAASAVLNRVVTGDPSEILGSLVSNGHVFLINPNGILFGRDATVDTAGLVASTLNLSDTDFLAGRMHFSGPPEAGAIRNEGYIKAAAGGAVVFIAPTIENSGIIETPQGQLMLAAGHSVSLVSLDSDYMNFEVTAPDGVTVNLGSLLAQGGAARVFAGTIRNAGTIAADSVAVGENGVVELRASTGVTLQEGSAITARGRDGADGGVISVTVAPSLDAQTPTRLVQAGTVDASGAHGGAVRLAADDVVIAGATRADGTVTGGVVEVTAHHDAEIDTGAMLSAQGGTGAGGAIVVDAGRRLATGGVQDARGDTGGTVQLLAGDEVVLGGALVDVRGEHGGGQVRVGGGFAGGEGLREARRTVIDSTSRIRADAVTDGDAGKVAVWSTEETDFRGHILARGGREGGDGGMVEVSGKTLTHAGTVDVTARAGDAGTLLLDPQFIIVQPGVIAGSVTFTDPDPGAGNHFGSAFDCFTGGFASGCGAGADRILFYDFLDDTNGVDAGALHLFDLTTGVKLSSLYGGVAGDELGTSSFITPNGIAAGTIVVRSFFGGGGAFTPFKLSTGLSGTVSTANSIVGAPGDNITAGSLQQFLIPGRLVLTRTAWGGNKGAVVTLNASDFSFASTGGYGLVGASNSLVGANAGDLVGGGGFTFVGGNNYLVRSPSFNGNAGAATLIGPTVAPTGVVGATNSIFGAAPGDNLASGGVNTALPGVALLLSPNFNGTRGAVTAFDPLTGRLKTGGTFGAIGAGNSLVGSAPGDFVGSDGLLTTGAQGWVYSASWNGSAGALTFYNASTHPVGPVDIGNSILGTFVGDDLGSGGIDRFTIPGRTVVLSPDFNFFAGAITVLDNVTGTFVNGGVFGSINPGNSLVGAAGDSIGDGSTYSTGLGGLYVHSTIWNSNAGALTFFDASTAPVGTLDVGNSIVGAPLDSLGSDGISTSTIFGQTFIFSGDAGLGAGAVTTLDSHTGQFIVGGGFGLIDSTNSFVGAAPGDAVGANGTFDIKSMSGGNRLLHTPAFNGNAGALTFFNGSTHLVGTLGAGNSVVGNAGDQLGSDGIESFLISGQTVVFSGGAGGGAGAVTVLNDADGTFVVGGVFGAIGGGNSLFGAASTDAVGAGGDNDFIGLNSGGYLLHSPDFNGFAGALTYFDGAATPVGTVGTGNSITGDAPGADLGSAGINPFVFSGKVVVFSPDALGTAGAVTVLDDTDGTFAVGGVLGAISGSNSLVGASPGDAVGSTGSLLSLGSGGRLLHTPDFNGNAGALTYFDAVTTPVGSVGIANSVFGNAPGANLGSGGIDRFSVSGRVLVFSPDALATFGAFTMLDDTNGTFVAGGGFGAIGGGNSLVGAATGDAIGNGGIFGLANGDFLLYSPDFNGSGGALTYIDDSGVPTLGAVDSSNSVFGNPGDNIGSGGINTDDQFGGVQNHVVVLSPQWNGGLGAATLLDLADGAFSVGGGFGLVSGANSLVGSVAGDSVGSGGFIDTASGVGLVYSPDWSLSAGALTFMSDTVNPVGNITASESIIGNPGDDIGSNGINTFSIANRVIVRSGAFNGTRGAVTLLDSATGEFVSGGGFGLVDSTNSLVGASVGDGIGGTFGLTNLDGTHFVIRSANFNGGAGALTWFNATTGVDGPVGIGNSLVGSTALDSIGSSGVSAIDGTRYAIASPLWDGAAQNVGAYTVADIATGITGTINSGNSLIGDQLNDRVGDMGVFGFFNFGNLGNMYYRIPTWHGGAGALALFRAGQAAPTDIVSVNNSLLGGTAGDGVGSTSIQNPFGNSGVLVLQFWDNGTATDAGAVVMIPNAGLVGDIDADTALVGTTAGDRVGSNGLQFLTPTSYVIRSSLWHGAAGALTFIGPNKLPVGEVSTFNSFVGATAGDGVSSIAFLNAPGKIAINTPFWDNGALVDAGAFTIVDSATGITGTPGATVSLIGTHANDRVGIDGFIADSGTFGLALISSHWNGDAGAVTLINPAAPTKGAVSASNSFTGPRAGDLIGDGGVISMGNGKFLVISPEASALDAGGNVLAGAGRVDVIGGTGGLGNPAQFGFNASPTGTVTLGATDIANFLATGATLVLQAHSDISFLAGAEIFSKNGVLSLQAGRSIIIEATIDPVQLDLFANFTGGGVDAQLRGAGDGNVVIRAGEKAVWVEAETLNVSGQNVILEGGTGADAFAAMIGAKVSLKADTLRLQAGTGANADAVLYVPTGLLDLEVANCIGCDELNFDPFLDPTTQTGIFKGFPDFTVAIDALLALGEPLEFLETSDESDAEEDERKLKQCR